MNLFRRIVEIGIRDTHDHHERRLIRSVNIFSILMLTGLITGLVNHFTHRYEVPIVMISVYALLSFLSLILNYFQMRSVAEWVFIININLSLFYTLQYYPIASGSYMFYFMLVLAIALLHKPGEKLWKISGYYVFTLCLFLATTLHRFTFITSAHLSPDQTNNHFTDNLIFTVFTSITLIILIIRVANQQSIELSARLANEIEAKKELNVTIQEKEILMKELHHRVKNNLAVVSSLINLQMGESQDPQLKSALNECRNRVLSMSMIHERLYQQKDLSHIRMDHYLSDLVSELVSNASHPIQLALQLNEIELNISQAIPIGLFVNEVVTNTMKHAFVNKENAKLSVQFYQKANILHLHIADNGKGFDQVQISEHEGKLGMVLIESLTQQLDGEVRMNNVNGAETQLEFPMATDLAPVV